MSTITAQEVFDRVATHLFTQGTQSLTSVGDICMYRGANGLKCAVGCLIPDELYDPKFEGNSIREAYEKLLPEEYHEHLDLLAGLQCVHDNTQSWLTPSSLYSALKRVAVLRSTDTDGVNTAAIDKYRDKTAWEGKKWARSPSRKSLIA